MAPGRPASQYVCQACAASSPRWEGQCRACGAWNTLVETILAPEPRGRRSRTAAGTTLSPAARPRPLGALGAEAVSRLPVGLPEVDRVLGGGLVPGALLLLAGEPGIGKSTLVLELAAGVARALLPRSGARADDGRSVLYASGEESGAQLHLRAARLGLATGAAGEGIRVVTATLVDDILEAAAEVRPDLVVVDSIQTLTADGLQGPAGSVGQVREAAARLGAYARESAVPVVLVGHVTKDGTLAGPRTLEHLVDVVLVLEGDRYGALRLLRGLKNRHGSTEETGVLEMTPDGLRDVPDAGRAFLGAMAAAAPGQAVAAVLEGSRPMLVEVQALVAPQGLGPPRRTLAGLDQNRLGLLLAVLARRARVDVTGRDIFASLTGGLSLDEPALDLPLALAVASSFRDRPLRPGAVSCGEVSLLGEIRAVRGLDRRLREAARLGFSSAIVPAAGGLGGDRPGTPEGLDLLPVRTLAEALELALSPAAGTSGEE